MCRAQRPKLGLFAIPVVAPQQSAKRCVRRPCKHEPERESVCHKHTSLHTHGLDFPHEQHNRLSTHTHTVSEAHAVCVCVLSAVSFSESSHKFMPTTSGPLILLSPAKSLSFDGTMAKALAAVTPTMPKFLSKSTELTSSLAKLSKKDIKTLMSLSDSLAELNHGRFQSFDEQPTRIAIGAFQGQAYQGLDAASLSSAELDYCQGHPRILCGLYGILFAL